MNDVNPTAAAGEGSTDQQDTEPNRKLSVRRRLQLDDENAVMPAEAFETADPSTSGVSRTRLTASSRRLGHRRIGEDGRTTYKRVVSDTLTGSIQLGIQHAIGGLAGKPDRDLLMQDFMTVETFFFPAAGSSHTPAHHYAGFKLKNYAPIAFRYFRALFNIEPDDFLISMCSAPLRELSNPGASGSIFYLTNDDEFIIKTVQHKEGEFLQKLLPGYYLNLNQNPWTLLPKFFGLFCYQLVGKNIRLVVMNNLLPSDVHFHEKYDLKGSTYGRKASKEEQKKSSPTYKDLDFLERHPEGLFLDADTYAAVTSTIQRDCRVLESFKIMDYSLLVGVHRVDEEAQEGNRPKARVMAHATPMESIKGPQHYLERQQKRHHTVAASSASPLDNTSQSHGDFPPDYRSHSYDNEPDEAGVPAKNSKGERLILYIGIIDILQSYKFRKKLEHTWKSLIHDGDTVSVHRPDFYSQRFQDFMSKTVFKRLPGAARSSTARRQRPLLPTRISVTSTLPSYSAAAAASAASTSWQTVTPVNQPITTPVSTWPSDHASVVSSSSGIGSRPSSASQTNDAICDTMVQEDTSNGRHVTRILLSSS